MHSDLEKLIRLQDAETDLRRTEAELSELPGRRADLDASLDAERARLDAARQGLEQCQQQRRRDEGQLQDLEQKRSKYKGQLMDVKTNKEYTAMLHEIEGVERDVRSVEDRILEQMERAETLAAEVKAEQGVFREAEERHREAVRQLDARAAELEAQAASHRAAREAAAASVYDELRERFQRVARLRGTGVAQAVDGRCDQCHVVLRPQMFVDVKRNDTIIECPSCSRILYYVEEPPTVEPPTG